MYTSIYYTGVTTIPYEGVLCNYVTLSVDNNEFDRNVLDSINKHVHISFLTSPKTYTESS